MGMAGRRGFVRVEEPLYSYRDGVVRTSTKPYEEGVNIDLKRTWFWDRMAGLMLGELILKQDMLIVTVRNEPNLR